MKPVLAAVALSVLAGCASKSGTYAHYPTAFDYPYPPHANGAQITAEQAAAAKAQQHAAPTAAQTATPIIPVAAAPMPTTAGAIYREGGGGLGLFQDQKARHPGDLLTITLTERTTATASTSTTSSKSSDTEMAIPSLFGAPVTIDGRDIGSTSTSGERNFSGTGQSAQSNQLSGSVTVTVVQRLANGNLVVRGDKLLRLNQSDEIVQIMGIVRSADIAPDNTVPSNRVADVRIAYGGRGQMAKSNVMGWMSRFFQSPYFPM